MPSMTRPQHSGSPRRNVAALPSGLISRPARGLRLGRLRFPGAALLLGWINLRGELPIGDFSWMVR